MDNWWLADGKIWRRFNMITDQDIENRFTYHDPKGQTEKYITIRGMAKSLALHLTETCPDSRELSLAITKLEEAVMWANAAIARNQ